MRVLFLCAAGLLLTAASYSQTQAPGANAPTPLPSAAGAPSSAPPAASGLARTQRMSARTSNARSAKGNRFKPEIAVNTPIITLDGVCAQTVKQSTKRDTCKTVVTRAQLDSVQDALDPSASGKARQQFALSYARLLAASQIAENQHLDQSPEVTRAIQVQQKIARMQVLSTALMQSLEKKAQHFPPKELEDYYKKYSTTFEMALVRRLVIPLNAPTTDGKTVGKTAAAAEMEKLHDLAVQGTDFDLLQARAYSDLNIKGDVPFTGLTLRHRGNLTADEQKVFDMDLGAVTPVFDDYGVLTILQVVSRKTESLKDAETEIEAVLLQQRIQEQLRDATQGITAEFNLKYMDAPTQPELFPPSVVAAGGLRRGMLSSLHVQP